MSALADLVATSSRVAATSSRLAKLRTMAEYLRSISPDELPVAIAWLSGETCQGKLGVSYAALRAARSAPAAHASLTLAEVDGRLHELAQIRGKGAASARKESLQTLFARATADEQDFLVRLMVGELRQGALRGLVTEAIAAAADLPSEAIRRAAMSAGGLGEVAQAAMRDGLEGLARFSIRAFQPVLPMLSQSAETVEAALASLGAAALEWKLDGARVQVHKSGDQVRVYTRNLNEVTERVPEVVEAVRKASATSLILDGEVIALRQDGSPLSFQLTMRRFGRKLEVDALRRELPLSVFFFDCLMRDDMPLTDAPAAARFEALQAAVPPETRVPRLVTEDPIEASAFFETAIAKGHEGVMVKALDAPYEAGKRGASWIKVKRANTLDLVVLAAEWGHGRRSGWLSNLHLGARDPASGEFIMLGKTFKGLTDDMLRWQTEAFAQLERERDGWTVYLRPEMVVEIAFNEIQESSQYPGGLALRFARVKGFRPDKGANEADTIDTVRALYRAQVHANA